MTSHKYWTMTCFIPIRYIWLFLPNAILHMHVISLKLNDMFWNVLILFPKGWVLNISRSVITNYFYSAIWIQIITMNDKTCFLLQNATINHFYNTTLPIRNNAMINHFYNSTLPILNNAMINHFYNSTLRIRNNAIINHLYNSTLPIRNNAMINHIYYSTLPIRNNAIINHFYKMPNNAMINNFANSVFTDIKQK